MDIRLDPKQNKINMLHEDIDSLIDGKKLDEFDASIGFLEERSLFENKSLNETINENIQNIFPENDGKEENLNAYTKQVLSSEHNYPVNNFSLEETIDLYKQVGSRNADFLFRWLYKVYNKTFLPSIDIAYKEILSVDKTKLTVFDVLIDDLADDVKIRNKRLLDEALAIPWLPSKRFNNQYLKITQKIWLDCINSIKLYPRYNEFEEIFYFDLNQVMNCMRYSFLVNTENLSNDLEDKIYLSHGVMVMLHCDMDLMCSPLFDYEEIKILRPILYLAQDVAHIANMLNTYPKEVGELDFSSPIISLSLRKGIITKNMIIKEPEIACSRLRSLIPYYEKRIKANLEEIKAQSGKITSIDMNDFYTRLEEVWSEFLKRRHYWKNSEKSKNFILE